MKNFDFSKIEFSQNDKSTDTLIPDFLSPILAEIIGIHVGDGSMGIYKNYVYQLQYGGDPYNDRRHYTDFIAPAFGTLFNRNVSPRIMPSRVYGFKLKSKAIVTFFNRIIGLPAGKKDSISVPQIIMNGNAKIKISFLRGLIDTDFGVVFSHNKTPSLVASFKSKNLARDVEGLFLELGFEPKTRFDVRYSKSREFLGNYIALRGPIQFERWMKIIGSHNPKHITKFLIWKKFEVCPKSTTDERINMLRKENLLLGK